MHPNLFFFCGRSPPPALTRGETSADFFLHVASFASLRLCYFLFFDALDSYGLCFPRLGVLDFVSLSVVLFYVVFPGFLTPLLSYTRFSKLCPLVHAQRH